MRTENNIDTGLTSVKVHAPPGGASNINIFGGSDHSGADNVHFGQKKGAGSAINQN